MCGSTCQLCSGEGLGILRDQEECSYFNFTVDENKVGILSTEEINKMK